MEFLKEDLLAERSLQSLTSAILLKFGDLIYDVLKVREGDMDLGTYSALLIKGLWNSKYLDKVNQGTEPFSDELQQFIVYTNIVVRIVRSSGRGASYQRYQGEYKMDERKNIRLKVIPEDFQREIVDNYNEGYIRNGRDVYLKLYYLFYSSLLHELRHAYDDFRTRGKAYEDKASQEFYKDQLTGKHKILKQAEKIADEAALEELDRISRQYVNLPHEVWARFSQAMAKIRFVNMEFDDDMKLPETMVPLQQVMKDFQIYMNHWRVLSEKMQRRLFKAVANAWHDAKDYLEKHGTYSNPHRKRLHEMDAQTKTQELEDEIEMRLRPDENFLPFHDIIAISDIFGMDEEDVAQEVSDFVLKREKEKYQEAKEDIEEYVAQLQKQGVRTDTQSDEALTKAFLEANGNYYVTEMGLNFDVLKNIMKMATKDPDQLALFEALRRQIQKTILRSLTGMA